MRFSPGWPAVAVLWLAIVPFQAARAGDVTDSAGADRPGARKALRKVRILSIDGASEVPVLKGFRSRVVGPGGELEYGERVRTEEKVSAVLLYPDDSKVTLLPKTDFQIEENQQGVQWNKLRSGEVLGVVSKHPESPSGEHKIHFLIRTRTATMGVRGTEFVMELAGAGGTAQVHTLEGAVEVAREETAVLAGKGAAVGTGQMVEATPSGLGTVQGFDKGEFLKDLGSKLPGSPGGASGASAGSSVASSGSSLLSGLRGAVSAPSSSAPQASLPPPPKPAPPPELPPSPDQLKDAENQKKLEEERQHPRLHLISFDLGGFYTEVGGGYFASGFAHWTPSLRLPVLYFLTVRGSFGLDFAQAGSLANDFAVREFQAFVVFTLFNPIYAELGAGEQIWLQPYQTDAGLVTLNVGLNLSKTKFLNRVFLGKSFFLGNPAFPQYKAGVGFQF